MAVRAGAFVELTVEGPFKGRRNFELVKAIERGLLNAGNRMIQKIRAFTPVFRGSLINSYQIRFIMAPRRGIKIVSPLSYAPVMEYGRRPGAKFPPMGPIRAWVQAKMGVTGKKLASVAFLVARAISVKGIRVSRTSGLRHNPGKGAMFRRAADALGAGFVSREIARSVQQAAIRIR